MKKLKEVMEDNNKVKPVNFEKLYIIFLLMAFLQAPVVLVILLAPEKIESAGPLAFFVLLLSFGDWC
jgi:hypothetical protein